MSLLVHGERRCFVNGPRSVRRMPPIAPNMTSLRLRPVTGRQEAVSQRSLVMEVPLEGKLDVATPILVAGRAGGATRPTSRPTSRRQIDDEVLGAATSFK